MKQKNKKELVVGILAASILRNVLAGKAVIKVGQN